MLESTSKFKVVDIIYDNGSFAIAKGSWADDKSGHRLACRWHEKDGIGYPQTFGKSQWMMFPDNIEVDALNLLDSEGSKVVLRFN